MAKSEVKESKEEKERIIYPLPDTDEVLFSINSDVELPQTSISLYYKFPVSKIETVNGYREELIENLYNIKNNLI